MIEDDQGGEEAMRSTCPTCETAYTIPDDRIGPKGRKVRCTRCGEEWRVLPEAAAAPAAPARVSRPVPVASEPAPDVADLFDAIDDAPEPSPSSDARPAAIDAVDVEADEPPAPTDDDVSASASPGAAETAETADDGATTAPSVARPAASRRPAHRRRSPHLRLPSIPPRVALFAGPAVFVLACLICTGFVLFRAQVVARLPVLAGLYRSVGLEVNLRGIVFGPIETLRETEDGKPVLVVEGTLTNTTGEMRDVPALRFALRDADAQELYAWSIDPRATSIAAGDRLRFRTRLVAPPERAADLQVRFAERRNRQAGLP